MTRLLSGALLALCAAGCSSNAPERTFSYPLDDELRINDVQAKGTHNSYHVRTPNVNFAEWNYTMAPLRQQLAEQGVRQFELDVYYDADVTRRFQVLHAPLADPGTTCPYLADCLQALKGWSDENPAHEPLFVMIEVKDQFDAGWAEGYFRELERAVTAVWPPERLVTPALVQGAAPDLPTALRARGWPTLGSARGRALFFLLLEDSWLGAYTHGGAGLTDRQFFAVGPRGARYAALLTFDEPVAQMDAIRQAVAEGYLVRTRSDESPEDLQDDTRLHAALASGAHMISTDYPARAAGISYAVEIPGGTPSRCNPLTAPSRCSSTAIEDPAFLAAPPE